MPLKGPLTDGFENYKKSQNLLQTSDLILLILYISPVKGNTMMQKQVFLSWREVFEFVTATQTYYPYKYGAYNNVLKDIISILEDKGFISIRRYGKLSIFKITEKGKQRIGKKITDMKLDLEKLSNKKTDWEEWSAKGIVRYVYRQYPEYAQETKVPHLKW